MKIRSLVLGSIHPPKSHVSEALHRPEIPPDRFSSPAAARSILPPGRCCVGPPGIGCHLLRECGWDQRSGVWKNPGRTWKNYSQNYSQNQRISHSFFVGRSLFFDLFVQLGRARELDLSDRETPSDSNEADEEDEFALGILFGGHDAL